MFDILDIFAEVGLFSSSTFLGMALNMHISGQSETFDSPLLRAHVAHVHKQAKKERKRTRLILYLAF